MAVSPSTDRPRHLPKGRLWQHVFSLVSLTAVVLAPVAALSLWLLISDPVTAAAVIERGDLLPVVEALFKMIGRALEAVFAAL
jgi:hypothetical protein